MGQVSAETAFRVYRDAVLTRLGKELAVVQDEIADIRPMLRFFSMLDTRHLKDSERLAIGGEQSRRTNEVHTLEEKAEKIEAMMELLQPLKRME